MTRIRMISLFAALALSAAALEAQGTTKAKKSTTPAQDSAKALKRVVKTDKADLAKAKASGDTARARALKKEIKADKKARKALKGRDTTSKKDAKKAPTTAKKP
jgi:hypothetical protein